VLLRYLRQVLLVALFGFVVGAAAAYFPGGRYVWVALFGAMIGASEIISRYRDAPAIALGAPPSIVYLCINIAASVGALALIEIFNWFAGPDNLQTTTQRVLVAGFGAMAVFRSSLFMLRVGNQDVHIGPVTFLESFLGAVDRGIDRVRGESRANKAKELMSGINFDKAVVVLVPFCLDLMQNLSADDGSRLVADIGKIKDSDSDPAMKSIRLGLKLMNAFGEGVVRAALKAAGPEVCDTVRIEITPASPIPLAANATQQLHANAYDPAGGAIAGKSFVWNSSDAAVATVDPSGMVTAKAAGRATITATTDLPATTAVTVNVS